MNCDLGTQEIDRAAFDAAEIFERHGWEWGGWSSPATVPTSREIADSLSAHLDRILDAIADGHEIYWSRSGRFRFDVDLEVAEKAIVSLELAAIDLTDDHPA